MGKRIDVKPLVSVGNVQFGMKRGLVTKMTFRNKHEAKEDPNGNTVDLYKNLLVFYDDNDAVIAIRIRNMESTVVVAGLGKLPNDFNKVSQLMLKADKEAKRYDDETCISSKLSMRLEGNSDGTIKYILFSRKGVIVAESYDIDDGEFNTYLESLEADDYTEYLTEGLFNKKEKVEIEVIYDDWEAHCTAYKVGDSTHALKSVSVDLPEKFHASNASNGDDNLPKGKWEQTFLKEVKKLVKGQFKEYNVVKWFVH